MQRMFDTKDMKTMIERQETIVCDWDGVIQSMDIVWAMLISQNREHFKGVFDEEKMYDPNSEEPYIKKIVDRDEYYLDKWMKLPDAELKQEMFDKFLDLYVNNEKFYEWCQFTPLAEGLAILVNQKFCNKIVFLSHTFSQFPDAQDERKRKAFESYKEKFLVSNDKMELVMIPSDIKKHDWIKENCPEYTCFIDDRFDIIEGVIDNTDSELKTFLMPIYGYNAKLLEGNLDFIKKVNEKKARFALITNVY